MWPSARLGGRPGGGGKGEGSRSKHSKTHDVSGFGRRQESGASGADMWQLQAWLLTDAAMVVPRVPLLGGVWRGAPRVPFTLLLQEPRRGLLPAQKA